jgi:hypothetical protein
MICQWCKEEVTEEPYVYEFKRNDKVIKHKGHKKCFEEYMKRKERRQSKNNIEGFQQVEEILCRIFEIPTLTGIMRKHIKKWYNDGFDYDVIYKAIEFSQQVILKNTDKPWQYHSVVIQSYFAMAKKKVDEAKFIEIRKKEIEGIPEKVIIIQNPRSNKDNKKDEFNIADL